MKKKLYRAEGGFTLVELLVTIAILAVLFGVVTLSLTGIGDNAETTVNAAELGVVQSAMDIAIAENNIGSGDIENANDCGPISTDTTIYTNADDTTVDIDDYLRLETINSTQRTKCGYEWTIDGQVTQGSTDGCLCP